MTTKTQIPFALTAHAIPHLMGYLATKSGEKSAGPLGWVGLMDTAVELGLSGVDLGIRFQDGSETERFAGALRERNLRVVSEFDVLSRHDLEETKQYIRSSAKVGAKVVRVMLSSILCGDRRNVEGGWEALLARSAERLRELLPLAEELGVALAVENHQDATSGDLLRLHEMVNHSPSFGVTLDAGNALAVGEDPVEFARRIGPIIRHIHMKDYTIHFAPEGYRLVRCAAGSGVVDFQAILEIVRMNGHGVLPGIEIGAQATRTIPILEAGWWEHHSQKQAAYLPGALRVLWAKGRPMDEPYSSAWERGEDSAGVSAEEWALLRQSVEYFRSIA